MLAKCTELEKEIQSLPALQRVCRWAELLQADELIAMGAQSIRISGNWIEVSFDVTEWIDNNYSLIDLNEDEPIIKSDYAGKMCYKKTVQVEKLVTIYLWGDKSEWDYYFKLLNDAKQTTRMEVL